MKKVLLFVMLAFATGLLFSCTSDDPESSSGSSSSFDNDGQDGSSSSAGNGGTGSLPYGGQTYKTVKIGEQTWFAENLNYNPNTGNSACYDNEPSNCGIYGRLYDWSTAMGFPSSCNSNDCAIQIQPKHRGICPPGWHIPNNDDWYKLFRYVDNVTGSGLYDSPTAGKHLKAVNGWNPAGRENLDTYEFSALPGGIGFGLDGGFRLIDFYGYWWSANENGSGSAYSLRMGDINDDISWFKESNNKLFSVRCLQD